MKRYKVLRDSIKKTNDGWEFEYHVWDDCYCSKVEKKGSIISDKPLFLRDVIKFDQKP